MLKKIIFSSLFLFLAAALSVSIFSMPVQADTTLDGLNQTANVVPAFQPQVGNWTGDFLQTKTGQIIGTVLSFIGVLFLIMMIYAGIMWMTAQGNDQQVTKAKDLLINSIIGMIIIFAAYAITTFIGNFVSNFAK